MPLLEGLVVHAADREGSRRGGRGQQTAFSAERVLGPGEALFGQVGGECAVVGRFGRVQLLAHRALFQELPEARRLRGGVAQGPEEPLLVETQEVADGHGRADGAGRAGGMEVCVVFRSECLADADGDFVARHGGGKEAGGRGGGRFGRREQCREYARSRMVDGRVV